MSVGLELRIQGISGYSDIYWPFASPRDVRGGSVPVKAIKIGNDPTFDVTVNLDTWLLTNDLSAGAWEKFHVPGNRRYYEPIHSGNLPYQTALAWTLQPEAPIMCGAGHYDRSGAYSFAKFAFFDSKIFGLDVKGNEVFSKGTAHANNWTDQNAGLGSAATDIFASYGGTDQLLVGQETGSARRYIVASGWADWSYGNAQHFVSVGKDLFYSTGNSVKEARTTKPRNIDVGLPSTDVNSMLWWKNKILIGKPEGLFLWGPNSKTASMIFDCSNRHANNLRVLIFYGGRAYFNADFGWFEYDGSQVREVTFAQFDSSDARPFKGGRVIGGYTDGRQMYLTFEVKEGSTYYHYIVIYNGRSGGYHPVFVAALSSASLPAYRNGGIFYYDERLYYSLADDRTGELLTDGVNPLCSSGNSIPFTKDVAVSLGWFDADRDHLPKHFKHWLVSTKDYNNQDKGKVQISYQKWTDNSFTDISGDVVSGTQDNAEVTPTAEGSSIAGFVTSKVNTKVTLQNDAASPTDAWYVTSLHIVGRPHYEPAFACTLNVLVDEEALAGNDRGYIASDVEASVLAALAQSQPVKLTWIDGTEYIGLIEPVPGGDLVLATDSESLSRARTRTIMVQFREDK